MGILLRIVIDRSNLIKRIIHGMASSGIANVAKHIAKPDVRPESVRKSIPHIAFEHGSDLASNIDEITSTIEKVRTQRGMIFEIAVLGFLLDIPLFDGRVIIRYARELNTMPVSSGQL